MPGTLSFGEKLKPYSDINREDYLLASDEKKSQMAAALSFKDKAKPYVSTDFGYEERLKGVAKTDEEIKKEEMIKSAAKGGLTMTFPKEGESVEEFAERTKYPEQKRENVARRDLELNYGKDRPGGGSLLGVDEDSVVAKEEIQKAAGLKEETKETKSLKEKTLNETKQSKESKDESKNLNNEISDLKDEVEKLKTTISDVNDIFKDLSDSTDSVVALGDASKDSASLIESLGGSASSASSSLDALSSRADTTTSTEETGPTMATDNEDFNFISEEDAIDLIDVTKGELLENINNIDNIETVNGLVEKTETLTTDVASIKEDVLAIPASVAAENFLALKEKADEYFIEVDKIKTIETTLSDLSNEVLTLTNKTTEDTIETTDEFASLDDFEDFKSVVMGYVETTDELKILTDEIVNTTSSHSTSILDLETAFDLVEGKLRNHDEQFTKFEESLGSMDHKFTNLISVLEDNVATAIDLARSAYNFATA